MKLSLRFLIGLLVATNVGGCKVMDTISDSYSKATESAIHVAIQDGELSDFLQVVKEQANQPASYPEGMSPLNRLLSSQNADTVNPLIRNQMLINLINNRSGWTDETYTRLVTYGTPQMIKTALQANIDINMRTPFKTKAGAFNTQFRGTRCPLVVHSIRLAGYGDNKKRKRTLDNFRTLIENKAKIHENCTGNFYGGPNSGIAGRNIFDLLAFRVTAGFSHTEDAIKTINILKEHKYYHDNFLKRAVARLKEKERMDRLAMARTQAKEAERKAREAEERRRAREESDRTWSVVLGTINAQLAAQQAERDRQKAQQDAITARINAKYYGTSSSSTPSSSSNNTSSSSTQSNNKPCKPDKKCRCQWDPAYTGFYNPPVDKNTPGSSAVCN